MTITRRKIVIASIASFVVAGIVAIVLLNLTPDRRELRNPVPQVNVMGDADFTRSIEGLFGSDVVPGNRIETLVNGDEIFPAMLEAIENAGTSINFETYIYWSGVMGDMFAEALSARAAEGVAVRVMMDWVGSQGIEAALLERLEQAGVVVSRFRPPRWYNVGRMNNRTHRKLLIVDGEIGFTGGVGIGDKWLGDARNPDEYRENHYRVTGPVVREMQGAFADNWVEATGELLQGPQHFPPLEPAGDMDVQLVASSTGSRNYLHLMKLLVMASAQTNIRIATPYFIPDDVTLQQLLAARQRGVNVEVLVPNTFIDLDLARHASRHFWKELLDADVAIYEYQPTFLHKKLMIIDDNMASIGSGNFDERSFRLNDEANLNVFDTVFAQEQIGLFERDMAEARRYTLEDWEARSYWTRTKDWFWAQWRIVL